MHTLLPALSRTAPMVVRTLSGRVASVPVRKAIAGALTQNPGAFQPVRTITQDIYEKYALKPIDPATVNWNKLPFAPTPTDTITFSICSKGIWEPAQKTPYDSIKVGPVSFHYASTGFEGLKCFRRKDGSVAIANLEESTDRYLRTMDRMGLPPIPKALAIELIEETVKQNEHFIPPFEAGHQDPPSFYLRPAFGNISDVLGVKPSDVTFSQVTGHPVGPYYGADGMKAINLFLTTQARALPGDGYNKMGPNYGPTIQKRNEAAAKGYNDVVYPTTGSQSAKDPILAEASSANLSFFTHEDGKPTLILNDNDEILPSTTKLALEKTARRMGIDVRYQEIRVSDVTSQDNETPNITMATIGTAAVMTPVDSITVEQTGNKINFQTQGGNASFDLFLSLREAYIQIMTGEAPDPDGIMTTVIPASN